MGGLGGLEGYCISCAEKALTDGDLPTAIEWLDQVPIATRPAALLGQIEYAQAMQCLGRCEWTQAEGHLAATLKAVNDPFVQRRLGLVRRRSPLQDDRTWASLRSKVEPTKRLPVDAYAPDLDGVWACGAYFSRGAGSGAPWSRFLRLAKSPGTEQEAALSLGSGYLCRFLAQETPLLAYAEAVVPVPPDPDRYTSRGMSLPDELAHGLERMLALPALFDAVEHSGQSVELRGLTRAERYKAVRGLFRSGERRWIEGRAVAVVDDVITSGATLRAVATVLRTMGASAVFGVALSHTEG